MNKSIKSLKKLLSLLSLVINLMHPCEIKVLFAKKKQLLSSNDAQKKPFRFENKHIKQTSNE